MPAPAARQPLDTQTQRLQNRGSLSMYTAISAVKAGFFTPVQSVKSPRKSKGRLNFRRSHQAMRVSANRKAQAGLYAGESTRPIWAFSNLEKVQNHEIFYSIPAPLPNRPLTA